MNKGVQMKIIKLFSILVLLTGGMLAQDTSQTFISLRTTGVEEFQNKFPEYDGRGTIVIVLDTGVDMGVDGLTKTSTGEVKVIDVQDFTGQGDTPYFEADIDEDNDNFPFIDNYHKDFRKILFINPVDSQRLRIQYGKEIPMTLHHTIME